MQQFYGDSFRWFIGVVVSNNDQLRVGRVRVRIYGVHSEDVNEVPESSLPWASCVVPTTEDGVSGLGRSPMLKAGAMVFGIFMDGQLSQQPLVMGSIPRIELPTEQQQGITGEFVRTITTTIEVPAQEADAGSKDVPTNGSSSNVQTLIGHTNTEKTFNFLVGQGYTPVQCSAIIGNFIVESRMDPEAVSGVAGEESFGIAQWNPAAGRLQQLQEFASDRNTDYTTLQTQLEFFHHDFSTLNPRLWGYNEFKQLTNIDEATRYFTDKYERPSISHIDRRIANAKKVLETYNK